MKRKLAIAFLAFVVLVLGATVAVLRTDWAGQRICALAERRVAEATGLDITLGACRIDPLRLEVEVVDVRLGPPSTPVFAADGVRVRLAPLQALGQRLHLEEVAAVRPRIALVVPPRPRGAPPGPCPPAALSQFDVHQLQVEDGTLDLSLPGGVQVLVGRFDVRNTGASGHEALRRLTARRSRVQLELGPTLVETRGRQLLVSEARVDADVALDLSRLSVRAAGLEAEGMRLEARGEVANLCRPELGLDLSGEAPLQALLALLSNRPPPAAGSVAARVRLHGSLQKPEASGEVRFQAARIAQYAPGDARVGFRFAGETVELGRIEVPFGAGGSITGTAALKLDRQASLAADLKVDGVEFADLVDRLGLKEAHVMMRLGARLKLAGTAIPFKLAGEVGLDAREFRVLDHPWTGYRPGEETVLDLARARIDSPVEVDVDGVQLVGAQVRAGAEAVQVSGRLSFRHTGGFDLAVQGTADLGELRHLSSVPMAGRAAVSASVKAVPYGPPLIEGRVRASGFHFLQLDLGEMEAAVRFDRRLVMQVREGVGSKGGTRYQAELDVDLGRHPVHLDFARLQARGRLRDLFDVVLPWLPGTQRLREAVDAQATVVGSASGPVPRLDATFDARLGAGELWGRPFESGLAQGRVEDGERAVFERAEIRRGSGQAKASGWIGFEPPSPWEVDIAASGARLGEIDLPPGGWAGTASATLSVRGTMEEPLLRFAASGEGVAVHGVPVGSVQVGGSVEHGRLKMTGTTPGVRFAGEARLRGDMPFQAQAQLDVEDVTRFIPGGPPAGLRAQVKGEATARGVLADLARAQASVRLERFQGGYGDFKVDNREPIAVDVDRGSVRVESFTLQGANTEFALQGSRAADGALSFTTGGSLDLRLLGGLVPAVTRTRGQLTVDAQVGGTDREPLLVGSGRVREGGFKIGDLPIEFSEMSGDLSFSQNRVLFDGLAASINGARAALSGEMELTRFVPTRIQVEAEVENVPLRIPSYIESRVSGRLRAEGSPDAMRLAGTLHVLRALYREPYELERRMLDIGRRRPEPRPYDKSLEWLGFDVRILVDGDARVDNDLVRGAVRGELTLTGSLAGYGLMGTLATVPGTRASFRGNEFNLSRGVLAFTERHRVSANLDVYGEASVRDYQVFMHLTGTLDDPRLALTSSPALSQQEIITLLALGYTTRDATVTPALGGATAAAAQALFAVSGLEQQLRRFLPRSGVFRDFTVRVTSAYSAATLQVEPRLEFETKALDNRLRLRYLAPIGGGRGQKAQLEYRFGERASLQGQWDNDNPDVGTGSDLGLDLKLRWEWND